MVYVSVWEWLATTPLFSNLLKTNNLQKKWRIQIAIIFLRVDKLLQACGATMLFFHIRVKVSDRDKLLFLLMTS